MATKLPNAGQDPAFQPNAALGLAAWTRTGTGIDLHKLVPEQSKTYLMQRLDLKRILAMSSVLVMHALVFGAMLLPAAPIAAIAPPPQDAPWVDVSHTPPPPPPHPPPVDQIPP